MENGGLKEKKGRSQLQFFFGTKLCSNSSPGALCRISEVQAAAWTWLTKRVRLQRSAHRPVRLAPLWLTPTCNFPHCAR